MRTLKFLSLLLLALMLQACPSTGNEGDDFFWGELPVNPVNLEDFNTEYDDYNMSLYALFSGRIVPFCFSTNRHSQGGEFDIRYDPMYVRWDKTTGDLSVKSDPERQKNSFVEKFGDLKNSGSVVNSEANELGPYLVYSPHDEFSDANLVLLYATDLDGDFDIRYAYNADTRNFSDTWPVGFLNSEFNDLYPVFNSDYSSIYFCSDREEGVFNIFSTGVEYSDGLIIGLLSDTLEHVVELEPVLSGDYDDKCPFIFGNTLVFTSNRPGGSGGFDLYYSKFEEGAWSEAVNFGAAINTEFDEYRPILLDAEVDSDRDMLLFSSDRTGGKGGFDLYYVGIPVEE